MAVFSIFSRKTLQNGSLQQFVVLFMQRWGEIYTPVLQKGPLGATSPLDRLPQTAIVIKNEPGAPEPKVFSPPAAETHGSRLARALRRCSRAAACFLVAVFSSSAGR